MIETFQFRIFAIFLLSMFVATTYASPGTGDTPPETLGQDAAGGDVPLNKYSGKPVVVTFWASWCPQCRKELPILEALQKKIGADRISVVGVNTEKPRVFRRAVRILSDTIHFELVNDAGGAVQRAYGVHGIPHLVIIDRNGRILEVHRGYSEEDLDGIVTDINRVLAPTQ